MSWDNTPFSNGFTLEGSLENTHTKGKNPILAYTFAPGNSWLSFQSPNLQALETDTKNSGKKNLDLLVSVQSDQSGLGRWFQTLKSNPKAFDKRLRIHIYTDPNKAFADKQIVLYGIQVKDPQPGAMSIPLPFTKRRFQLPLPPRIYTVQYGSLEVV